MRKRWIAVAMAICVAMGSVVSENSTLLAAETGTEMMEMENVAELEDAEPTEELEIVTESTEIAVEGTEATTGDAEAVTEASEQMEEELKIQQIAETEQPTEMTAAEETEQFAETEDSTETEQSLNIEEPLLEQGLQLYAADDSSAADNFDLAVYQAERFLDSTSSSYKNITSYAQIKMPSKIVVELLDADGCFQNSVKAWKAANIAVSPTEIADGKLDEQGYYEAIIFSLFLTQTSSENYLYKIVNTSATETNKILGQIEKWVKETDQLTAKIDIKNGKITDVPPDDAEKIKKYLSELFEKEHPSLKSTGKIASNVADVFEFTDSVVDGVKMLASYMQFAQMGMEMKTVLLEMYAQCPSEKKILKEALRNAATSTANMEAAFSVGALKATGDMAYSVVKEVLDDWWTTLLNSNPYTKAFLGGAKLGIFISNTLFSTDKTIEQYEKMKCLGEVDEVVRTTIGSLNRKFQAGKTTANAQSYIEAVYLMYKVGDISCDFALSYADVIYGDTVPGALQVLCGDKTYEEYKQVVTNMKNDSASLQDGLRKDYLYDLESEYPEIYAALMEEKQEAGTVAVTGIEFPQDECTVYLGDEYNPFVSPAVTPVNATNSSVQYKSSDPSVLEISGPIVVLKPHKAGTVTVTATTDDGGFTDTITVHVVEGNSSESNESINVPGVIEHGKCGDSVWYMLFADGTLRIDGEGEMEDYSDRLFESGTTSPFWSYRDEIKNVKIGDGVTSVGDYAFSDCRSLTSITISESVTNIGKFSFGYCENLTSIGSLESVTSIGEYAFHYCLSLTSITIPESVTCIGEGTFYSCYSLTSITIPESVTSIGEDAFYGCDITNITIPESVTNIGRGAFYSCISLTNITIPESVTSIEEYVLCSCSSLTNITIPESVTSIGEHAFSGCRSLMSIAIPESVTSIGRFAFRRCSSLTSITIPESVTYIEETIFDGCSNLASITIPKSVAHIEENAFSACDKLTIYCEKDSYAHQYAIDHNIPYQLLGSTEQKDISECTVTLSPASCTYTGAAQTPAVTVKDGVQTLQQNVDYTVSYANNINVGTATVTVKGMGNYTGSKTVNFQITATGSGSGAESEKEPEQKPTVRDISSCTVSKIENQFYTGKEQKPSVTVMDGSTILKKDADYTVSYANNTKAGKATVTVRGKGNYTGDKTVNFQIVETVSGVKASSAGYNSVKVSWEKVSGVTGYKIYRADSKNGKYKCVKTIKGEGKTSCKDAKLTTGKAYYYQVKPYLGKQEGSASKTVSVKPVPAKVKLSSVKNSKSKTVIVKWKKVSGASGYEIYSATSKSGKYKKVATVKKGKTTSYKNTKLKKGTTYYYKVRAYRTVNGKKVYGSYSGLKSVKIKK